MTVVPYRQWQTEDVTDEADQYQKRGDALFHQWFIITKGIRDVQNHPDEKKGKAVLSPGAEASPILLSGTVVCRSEGLDHDLLGITHDQDLNQERELDLDHTARSLFQKVGAGLALQEKLVFQDQLVRMDIIQ